MNLTVSETTFINKYKELVTYPASPEGLTIVRRKFRHLHGWSRVFTLAVL